MFTLKRNDLHRVPNPNLSPFRVKKLNKSSKNSSKLPKMDSINVVSLTIEKVNVIKRFNRLRTITILFRLIEILFILVILSRFFVKIPIKLSLSGEYIRQAYYAVFSPSFVFIVGNAIVVTLFLKSGRVSDTSTCLDPRLNSTNFVKEHVEIKKSEVQLQASAGFATVTDHNLIRPSKDIVKSNAGLEVKQETERKMMGRSKSGELGSTRAPPRQLRRSVTELERERIPKVAAEDMSGEEFRRRVEDFIARQQRSLREDEFSAISTF